MLTKLKNLFTKEEKAEAEETVDSTIQTSGDMKTPETEIASAEKNNVGIEENTFDKVEQPAEDKKQHSTEEIKEEVIKVLKTCYDPEIPVDVWELGLIYEIKVATNGDVLIIMTLTSPSCPVAGILPGEIEQKVREHAMVNECKVELTFDPPWSQKNMSEVAKLELGFL